MKNAENIMAEITRMEKEERLRGDGGYSLVARIERYTQSLSTEESEHLRVFLLEQVRSEDSKLWGVSLEALSRMWGPSLPEALYTIAVSPETSQAVRTQIALVLMRHSLDYYSLYEPHLNDLIAQGRSESLMLSAHLAQVRPGKSLDFAVRAFQRCAKDGVRVTGFVPTFVSVYFDVDADLLVRLVERLCETEPDLAATVGTSINEYLQKPFSLSGADKLKLDKLCKDLDLIIHSK